MMLQLCSSHAVASHVPSVVCQLHIIAAMLAITFAQLVEAVEGSLARMQVVAPIATLTGAMLVVRSGLIKPRYADAVSIVMWMVDVVARLVLIVALVHHAINATKMALVPTAKNDSTTFF